MRRHLPWVLWSVAAVAASCGRSWAEEPAVRGATEAHARLNERERETLLHVVEIPDEKLPKRVSLATGTSLLFPNSGNPGVVVDVESIRRIALFFGITKQADLEKVRAVVFAVYQEGDPATELGVYGLVFQKEADAEAWFKLLKRNATPLFARKGKVLVYLWKDDLVSDAAFKAMGDYFHQKR